MEDAMMTTREVGVHSFQEGIFMSGANLLSPVAVYPRTQFQSLTDFFEEQETHPKNWASFAGPAGIGQYSLTKGKPVGVLARFETHFRNPSIEEMHNDLENFGEQVIGPSLKEASEKEREEYKDNLTVKVLGDEFYFVGPPRLIKSVFLSRVFSGDVPKDISALVREVDEIRETGEMVTFQGYQFLHSINGKIMYLPFGKIESYDPSKMKLFGSVEIEHSKMTYYPQGDESHPIDFTSTIIRSSS